MESYIHKVNYYETDKMGITHHSNYIRWMEEARVDFLEKIGWGFDYLEEQGIMSPVIGIDCEYKSNTKFTDEVLIKVNIREFNGVKLVIQYEMINTKTNKTALVGTSKHCFINEKGMPIRLKNELPEFDKKLRELAIKEK